MTQERIVNALKVEFGGDAEAEQVTASVGCFSVASPRFDDVPQFRWDRAVVRQVLSRDEITYVDLLEPVEELH